MVAYFRKQIYLFVFLGTLIGAAAAVLFREQLTASVPGYFGMFFLLMPVILGAILGRFYASIWANKKLRQYNELLYARVEPEEFLKVFTPLVQKAPKDNIAYVDGCNKLAYAHEAMGRFDEAINCINALEPEKLKLHALGGIAMTCNQQLRLLLLQEKQEEAREVLQQLRNIAEVAMARAPMLGRNTNECVRLYENWLLVLEGQPADEAYLEEEIRLSKNRIHKAEIQLVLAKACENRGDTVQADELRLDAMTTGKGLYAERRARELLGSVSR